MSKKKNIYEQCCDEIVYICRLVPGWSLSTFLIEEELDIKQPVSLYNTLKQYREQLELVSKIIADDDETKKIMDEGLKIHNIIIKEQMYGSDEN